MTIAYSKRTSVLDSVFWMLMPLWLIIQLIWILLYSYHLSSRETGAWLPAGQLAAMGITVAVAGVGILKEAFSYAGRLCVGLVAIFYAGYVMMLPPMPFISTTRATWIILVSQVIWAILAVRIRPLVLRKPLAKELLNQAKDLMKPFYGTLVKRTQLVLVQILGIAIVLVFGWHLLWTLDPAVFTGRGWIRGAGLAEPLLLVWLVPASNFSQMCWPIRQAEAPNDKTVLAGFMAETCVITLSSAIVFFVTAEQPFAPVSLLAYVVIIFAVTSSICNFFHLRSLARTFDFRGAHRQFLDLYRAAPDIAPKLFFRAPLAIVEPLQDGLHVVTTQVDEIIPWARLKHICMVPDSRQVRSIVTDDGREILIRRILPSNLLEDVWNRWLIGIDSDIAEFRLQGSFSKWDKSAVGIRFENGLAVVLYQNGRSHVQRLSDLRSSNISPTAVGRSGFIKFRDGETVRQLFSMSNWPLLRKKLLDMKPAEVKLS